MTETGSTTRRKLLTAVTAASSLALSGCLTRSNISLLANGPQIDAHGTDHSKVFLGVSAAETVSFGHIISASVGVTGAALYEFGVTELEVFAKGERPYSASTVPSAPGPKQTKINTIVQLPVDATSTIVATNENGTLVEAIRVTTGGTPIYTGQSLEQTRTPMAEPTVEILTSTLKTEQTQFSTDAAVYAKVKNASDTETLTHLEVKAEFINEAGVVIHTSFENIRNVAPTEIWEVVIPYLGDASATDSATPSIETAIVGAEPIPPTNVTLLEERLELPEKDVEPPTVSGRIENTGTEELPYLEADVKFYAENGTLLGDNSDSVTGLDPNQVWEFDVPFLAYSNEIANRVDSYELTFVT